MGIGDWGLGIGDWGLGIGQLRLVYLQSESFGKSAGCRSDGLSQQIGRAHV